MVSESKIYFAKVWFSKIMNSLLMDTIRDGSVPIYNGSSTGNSSLKIVTDPSLIVSISGELVPIFDSSGTGTKIGSRFPIPSNFILI